VTDTPIAAASDEDRETWRRFLKGDSYGLVLALTLAVFMLPVIVPDDRAWRSVIVVMAAASVLLSLHTSRVRAPVFWTAAILSAVAIAGLLIDDNRDDAHGLTFVIIGLLLIASPAAILNRIARHGHITVRTLLGAIDVYLQIGIAFSYIYQAMYHFDDGAFAGIDFTPAAFTYYSFVTLSTLGYGDALPVAPLARNLAVLEAILGQVFLVVVVAQVVTRLGTKRGFGERTAGHEADA
jgi:hypothetical protein